MVFPPGASEDKEEEEEGREVDALPIPPVDDDPFVSASFDAFLVAATPRHLSRVTNR